MSKPYGTFAIGLLAAVVMLIGTMAMGSGTAEASMHRFPTPGGGHACKGLNFQYATDWGVGGIVVKHTSCKRAHVVITRRFKYGRPIAWSEELRAHYVGLTHSDVRLRRGRAVIVCHAY
jgi:hypothetical protein